MADATDPTQPAAPAPDQTPATEPQEPSGPAPEPVQQPAVEPATAPAQPVPAVSPDPSSGATPSTSPDPSAPATGDAPSTEPVGNAPAQQVADAPKPTAPQPVTVDNRTKRNDDDALAGGWVDVVDGPYKGRYGAYESTVSHGEDGYPEVILVRTRDAANEVVEVEYEHVRPSERTGGR